LLFNPEVPEKVVFVIQAKNQAIPLTYDNTIIELIKFHERGQKKYDCASYKLISINGYVKGTRDLQRMNLTLHSWNYIEEELISDYKKDGRTEPKLELYPHNNLSYEKVKEYFDKTQKTCLIQATGTGKSYVISKLIADNIKTKSIILAPSHYILNQFKEKFQFVLLNCDLMTYAKLSRYTSNEFINKRYDFIVLDEFHRPGAKSWGKGVQRLLEINKNAKVFGTSATPIRYLDHRRDMSSELFEGNIAENITLISAIVRGILKAPVYVSALYTLNEETDNLKQKISDSNLDSSEKTEQLEAIENAHINWEKTKNIPEIDY